MSEIQEILTRFWDQLIAQPHGPLAFRLILQPLMATFFAIRDGLKDARAGRPLYTCAILTDPAQRKPASGAEWPFRQTTSKSMIAAISTLAIAPTPGCTFSS